MSLIYGDGHHGNKKSEHCCYATGGTPPRLPSLRHVTSAVTRHTITARHCASSRCRLALALLNLSYIREHGLRHYIYAESDGITEHVYTRRRERGAGHHAGGAWRQKEWVGVALAGQGQWYQNGRAGRWHHNTSGWSAIPHVVTIAVTTFATISSSYE